LLDRIKKIWFDAAFREGEVIARRDLQRAESERLGIETTGWTGKKRDVIPFAEEFCIRLGFERHRNRWRKRIDGDLVFEVGVDLGGNPYCIGPPLIFRIFHVDDPKFVFLITGAAVFARLVPEFAVYAACGDASDYVLGIKAHIELFDVIAGSFEQAAARSED